MNARGFTLCSLCLRGEPKVKVLYPTPARRAFWKIIVILREDLQ